MSRVVRAMVLSAVALPGLACSADGAGDEVVAGLMTLYEERDYFELRARLDTVPGLAGPSVSFLRAVVAHAFNQPERSNAHLQGLRGGASGIPDTLRVDAEEMRAQNHMRLHRYAAALDALETLLSLPGLDSSARDNAANLARAMAALADAPPQRVVSRAASRIEPAPDGRVPIRIGDADRSYAFDTGANLSTLMRSEAGSLGLRVRAAGLEVGTSTGSSVTADVTVAPRLQMGGVVLENVVFLVVPDELLTFGDFRIPGLLGFPVLQALGEVEFHRGGVLQVPGAVPVRDVRNLAVDFLTPLIQVEVLGSHAICYFDTGANTSSLHLPFFQRHRARVEAEGRMDTVRFAGAGGERRMPARVLTDVRLAFGDTVTTLPELPVYTESVATEDEPRPRDCRLGLDALAAFDGYLLNLRSMTFMPL